MSKKTEYTFMQVNKAHFNDDELKPIDILVLSQIEELIRNGKECYLTNEQLSDIFHVTPRTVANTIDRLESMGYIKRRTVLRRDNGQKSRIRFIDLGESWSKKTHPHQIMLE